MLLLIEPSAAIAYYIPFLHGTASNFSLDPWSDWIDGGGSEMAFPYGYAMYLTFLPAFTFGNLIALPPFLAYFFVLIFCEILVLGILMEQIKSEKKLIIWLFWLSPVNILALYFYGYNDIVPVLFLTLCILYLRNQNWFGAGATLACAISAKLSMLIAAPLIFLFLLNNDGVRHGLREFLFSFVFIYLGLSLVYVWSSDAWDMLFGNPEFEKVLSLTLKIFGRDLLVVPILYGLFLYWVWRIRRINVEMMIALIGISFLCFAMLFSDTPGWLLWSVPFLTFYQSNKKKMSIIFVYIFSFLFMAQAIIKNQIFSSGELINTSIPFITARWSNAVAFDSILLSFVVCVGGVLLLRIVRETIYESSFFRATRHPIMIAIAGDSGSGKDTLAEALINFSGKASAINVSGDDYHRYDRSKRNWISITHLNPIANNLEEFAADLWRLRNYQPVWKRHYDHSTGKLSRLEKIAPRDLILVSGLHSYFNSKLHKLFDVRVYLDMDEDLRRFFKVRRDVFKRRKTLDSTLQSIEKRSSDYKKFVAPQARKADVIFKLGCIHALNWEREEDPSEFFLDVHLSQICDYTLVVNLLAGVCQCEIFPLKEYSQDKFSFEVRGSVSSDTILLAAKFAGIQNDLLFDDYPIWENGMLGIMQLITVVYLKSALNQKAAG